MKTSFLIGHLFIVLLLVTACAGPALKPKQLGDKWGYVDKSGNFVVEPRFDYAREFRNGFAIVCNTRSVYRRPKVDKDLLDEGVYYEKDEGYFIDKTVYGYVNSRGEVIVEPQYDVADDFKNGRARVGRENSYAIAVGDYLTAHYIGYIDTSGNVVVPVE